MKRLTTIMLAVAGLMVAVRPAAAQLQALPVYFTPKGGTGLTLSGDFGRVSSAKFGTLSSTVHPTTIAGRATLGLPFFTVGVGVGIYDPKIATAGTETQFAATAAIKVLGGPLIPLAVSLQGGVGSLKSGTTSQTNFPIGVGVALNIPTPGASLEPWLAGRIHINSVSAGGSSGSQMGYGISGGISAGLPIGVGIHLGIDWAKFNGKPTSPLVSLRPDVQSLVVGVGLHYSIKIPGLGVPVVPGV